MKQSKRKIFVGLSGGVDSSVATALLKHDNYDVVGVFIRGWMPSFLPCTWKEDRLDAMKVATHLQISFKTLDLSKEYKKEVIDYMISEYKAGRTPNPDVMCNKQIKFGLFLKWALKQGADFVATGHHVRMQNAKCKMQNDNEKLKKILLMGKDKNKDQSYFLWTLTQNQLKHALFPIGDYTKTQVRALAKKFKLPTADKKDSHGLCFVGKVNMKEFLKKFIKEKKGKILNKKGEVIGTHEGAHFYTIGQRHGFTVIKKGTDDKPYYIMSKDMKGNTITVETRQPDNQTTRQPGVEVHKVNWISKKPTVNKSYKARIRYRQPLQNCKIKKHSKSECIISFSKPQQAVTSGQSLVIYDGPICLGGGVIK